MAMKKVNYLLGRAEKLVRRIDPPPINPAKAHPYTLEQAIARVVPKMDTTAKALAKLPKAACPHDEAVALLALHPAYLAKSYFPANLLDEANLRAVGSRQRILSPEAWAIKNPPKEAITAELFVAGKRKDFERFSALASQLLDISKSGIDLRKIEDFRAYPVSERLRTTHPHSDAPLWEIVLHATEFAESDYILDGFRDYMASLDVKVNLDDRLQAQGLCFLPVRVPRLQIVEVAKFSFLRAAREMPHMRPVIRMSKSSPSFKYDLPDSDVVDPTIRAVTFDGGLPAVPDISRWSNRRKASGVGAAHPDLVEHGLGVTSALLFGPLESGVPLPRPYAKVDHFRVLDVDSVSDDTEDYFDIIKRILSILESGRYDFANFSIGPDLPVEDDDVHVWTAMLDQFLRKGTLLASIAAGNSGEKDHASGNARIQSPSDCVNALTFGSADCLGAGWKRAPHSSIGPGRSPGVVKPDLLSFGGCSKSPFYVMGMNDHAEGRLGTSFASPSGLRAAMGVRACLGPIMSPLALKALLIHRSDSSDHPQHEVGWGKVAETLESLIECEDSVAYIVYQGEITPGSWMRAPIPVPDDPMTGMIELRATICFACETDPQDPIHYTRSGLEVRFRPHDGKKKEAKQREPNTKSFFNAGSLYAGEGELRSDFHKWETTLHARERMRGSSLQNPSFDIHYNAREGGGKAGKPQDIPYALIVSVHAPKVKDLYDRIFRRYRTTLEAMKPVIEIPVRTKGS
ncbi:MAG: S8 family peptidase [Planctomycetaceae bacterium]|nr:S8 family peptidase [Planctomycetaceae bacterium]